MSSKSSDIGAAYRESLHQRYDPQIVEEITDNWRFAELPDQPGETIAYVRLNQGVGVKPVMYIPGFTEGITSKAPFAAELAENGFDVILPDQNRKKILKDPTTDKKGATYTQALNYLAVLRAEGLDRVNVITHSYGSLIFDTMYRIAQSDGQHFFDDARVIMLAPAGFNKEHLFSLGARFAANLKSEEKKTPRDFPDQPEMFKAGVSNLRDNLSRTAREVLDLKRHQVNYVRMLGSGLGEISVLSYAADRLYSDEVLYPGMEVAINDGVRWLVPITQDGERYLGSKPTATHNDEQFNPTRVVASVTELLRQERNQATQ